MASPSPLGSLQTLRGLAAWMVCVYHFAFLFKHTYPFMVDGLDWGQNGVYVFFVISGVVLPWSLDQVSYGYRNFWPFMQKRLLRLYPPFALSVLVCAVAFHATHLFTWPVAEKVIDSLTFAVPFKHSHWVNGVYWTLFVEFQYYIYLGLLFPLLAHRSLVVRSCAIYGSLALSFCSAWFPPADVKNNIFFHLPIFTLGFTLYLYLKDRISSAEFAVASSISAWVMFYETGVFHGFMWNIPVFGALTFFIILFFQKGIGFFDKLGEISYSYYLTHFVFISMVNNHMKSLVKSPWGIFVCIAVLQVATYYGAKLFYHIIEKPSLRWTKRVVYKKIG
jgi:peptidoglycan/LPS O-acetylase OafA/YrhL